MRSSSLVCVLALVLVLYISSVHAIRNNPVQDAKAQQIAAKAVAAAAKLQTKMNTIKSLLKKDMLTEEGIKAVAKQKKAQLAADQIKRQKKKELEQVAAFKAHVGSVDFKALQKEKAATMKVLAQEQAAKASTRAVVAKGDNKERLEENEINQLYATLPADWV